MSEDTFKPIHPLKKIREKYNLTQSDLETILGLKKFLISQIEKNKSRLPKRRYYDVCQYFHLDPEQFKTEMELFQEKKYPKPSCERK